MSNLSIVLNRFFSEVNLLYVLPKKGKAKFEYAGSLFDSPPKSQWVQVYPGLFASIPVSLEESRVCFYILDTPTPLVMPGLFSDFTLTDFSVKVYQVPIFTGLGSKVRYNIDERFMEKVVQQEFLMSAKELDRLVQQFLEAISTQETLAEQTRQLMESLRIWALEDYMKPAFLESLQPALAKFNAFLNVQKPASSFKSLIQDLDAIMKQIVALLKIVNKEDLYLDIFTRIFCQLSPSFEDEALQDLFKSFIINPDGNRLMLRDNETKGIPVSSPFFKLKENKPFPMINDGYSRFFERQLELIEAG